MIHSNYPLIFATERKKRKKPKMMLLEIPKIQKNRSRVENCKGIDSVSTQDGESIVGVEHRLKRGRPCKSVAKECGIGQVILEGGIVLEDSEIENCNRLLIRKKEVDNLEVWQIGWGYSRNRISWR